MNDARGWWRAVLRRDPAFDGAFVFAVLTTAVYCRASCPARRPRRRNVEFFRTAEAAEREGFRRCRRCGPGEPGSVLRACAFIARHAAEPLTLERIARHAGWSAFHLQRVFRRSLGVSPKQYARILRFERFRASARTRPDVTAAMLDAGFGSSSRLYERSKTHLGMTPRTYQSKGKGMDIAYDVVDCPLGKALIAATPLGLCAVQLGRSARELAARLHEGFPRASIRRSPPLLRFARERLQRLFRGGVSDARLPLDVRATAFQARVWESLRSIPPGETRSYGELARALGRPGAARAVGRACGSNPVALVIPCHRVVEADGGLGGYRWGVERKKRLLEAERRRQ